MSSVRILSGLYAFIGIKEIEIPLIDKEDFIKNDSLWRLEYLVKQKPDTLKIIGASSNDGLFYTPRLGNFIISNSPNHLMNYKQKWDAQIEANNMHIKIEYELVNALLYIFQCRKNVISNKPQNPKKWKN